MPSWIRWSRFQNGCTAGTVLDVLVCQQLQGWTKTAQETSLLLSKPLSWGSCQRISRSITPTFQSGLSMNRMELSLDICRTVIVKMSVYDCKARWWLPVLKWRAKNQRLLYEEIWLKRARGGVKMVPLWLMWSHFQPFSKTWLLGKKHSIFRSGTVFQNGFLGFMIAKINSCLYQGPTCDCWVAVLCLAQQSQTSRNNQSLKGAVIVTLCQKEADVKFQMDIESHVSLTEQAGKIRLMRKFSQSDFPCLFCGWDWWSMSIWNFTCASFWKRVTTTAPFSQLADLKKEAY